MSPNRVNARQIRIVIGKCAPSPSLSFSSGATLPPSSTQQVLTHRCALARSLQALREGPPRPRQVAHDAVRSGQDSRPDRARRWPQGHRQGRHGRRASRALLRPLLAPCCRACATADADSYRSLLVPAVGPAASDHGEVHEADRRQAQEGQGRALGLMRMMTLRTTSSSRRGSLRGHGESQVQEICTEGGGLAAPAAAAAHDDSSWLSDDEPSMAPPSPPALPLPLPLAPTPAPAAASRSRSSLRVCTPWWRESWSGRANRFEQPG